MTDTFTKAMPIPRWENLSTEEQTQEFLSFLGEHADREDFQECVIEAIADCKPEAVAEWFFNEVQPNLKKKELPTMCKAIVGLVYRWFHDDAIEHYEKYRIDIDNGEYDG